MAHGRCSTSFLNLSSLDTMACQCLLAITLSLLRMLATSHRSKRSLITPNWCVSFGSLAFSYRLSQIGYLKTEVYHIDMPVLAFGGSYGGMLTAWFKLVRKFSEQLMRTCSPFLSRVQKYPQVVDGALAASAPVLQFYNTPVSQWAFWEDTTYDFQAANPACPPRVLSALRGIQTLGQTADGLAQLTKVTAKKERDQCKSRGLTSGEDLQLVRAAQASERRH
jgi:hypothetical protein